MCRRRIGLESCGVDVGFERQGSAIGFVARLVVYGLEADCGGESALLGGWVVLGCSSAALCFSMFADFTPGDAADRAG